MEVEMTKESPAQVDVLADRALVNWKCRFADLIKSGASRIAAAEDADVITLSHYQQGAEQSLLELSGLIQTETIRVRKVS